MHHACLFDRAGAVTVVAKCLPRMAAVFALIAAVAGNSPQPAAAEDTKASAPPSASSIGPKCSVVPDLARLELPLNRVAFRVSGGLPVKVVAIGSSSTAGAGASSPSASYPSRLEGELGRQFPGHQVTVVNRWLDPGLLTRPIAIMIRWAVRADEKIASTAENGRPEGSRC